MSRVWVNIVLGAGLFAVLMACDADAAPATKPGTASGEVLSTTLQGEFALQDGDSRQAAAKYLQAASQSSDPALAQRAAEVALLAHEDALAERAMVRWRQLDPKSDDLASLDALLALRKGDRAGARRDLLAMLAADGDGWKRAIRVLASATDSPTSALVADDLFTQGRWPADIEVWLAFGEVTRRLGDAALTQRVIGDVVRRFPRDPRAWLLESSRLGEHGDHAAAVQALDRAASLGGGDVKMRNLVAAAYARLDDPKTAAALIAKGAQDDSSYIARAAYLAKADDRVGLAALYAEVQAQSSTPDAEGSLLLGQLAEYLKHPDEALAWYRGVPEGAAHDDAQNRIAIVLESRGDLEGALRILRSQHSDANSSADAQVDSFRIEAEFLAKHDRNDEALAAYDRGLAFFDGDADLLYGRALLLEDMDREPEAEADLRTIVTADPNNADALNALGYTLADRTDHYAEAQALIEKALQLQPDSPAFLDSLGWVQHRLGRDVEALHNLRRAFALLKDPEIAAHLGEVMWLDGDKDGARAVWKQGLALDKDNRAMQRMIQTYKP